MLDGSPVPVRTGAVLLVTLSVEDAPVSLAGVSARSMLASGGSVSTEYDSVSVAVTVLPATSVVVTLASITPSPSATRSDPGTSIEKRSVPASSNTNPSWAVPFTVSVTTSPTWTSPPTTPVTATVPNASAASMMSSAVMAASSVIDAAIAVSTTKLFVAVVVLPAPSVVETAISIVPSLRLDGAVSSAATALDRSRLQLPSAAAVVV